MGNCVQERKPLHTLFDQQELKKLNQVFDSQCDLLEETRKNRQLSQQSFEEIFIENPEFGRKMFTFLEVFGQKEKYILRDTLFYILEVLTKDASSLQSLRNLSRIEIFVLMSLKSFQYIKNKEDLHSFKITYLDAFTIINDILRIRLSGDKFQNIDEKATRAILDSIYKVENGTIEWYELMKQLKIRLGGLSILIKQYFKNKFQHTKIQQQIPTLSQNSYLLNEDSLFLLSICSHNTKLKGSIKLELLYSNLVHHGGFKQLVNNLLTSELPTLILCQHEEKYSNLNDEGKLIKTNILGAISNQRWFDTGLPQGDEKDCIFSIYPQMAVFHPKKDRKASKNYCYFNSKDLSKPQGIGFGFNENKFRLWIDKDLKNSSCTHEDQTFEQGDLVQKHIKKLQISIIEIWGIVQPNIEEQMEEQKIANADMGIEQIDFNYNEEPPTQIEESNSNYYWSNKQEERKVETQGSNSFYWNNSKPSAQQNYGNYSNLTKSYPISTIQPQEQQINDMIIAKKLTDPQLSEQNAQSFKGPTVPRRSNLQRPVLDFVQKPSSVNPPSQNSNQFVLPQPESRKDSQYLLDKRNDQNIVFGSKLEETKYPNDNFSNQFSQNNTLNNKAHSQSSLSLGASSRGRKTADQIIQDYELRKSKKQ